MHNDMHMLLLAMAGATSHYTPHLWRVYDKYLLRRRVECCFCKIGGGGRLGLGFTLSCLQCVKIHAFKLVLRPILHSLFYFFRLRRVTSAASLRIARLQFHIFIFCDIFPNFHPPLHLPICMKSEHSYLSTLAHSCP